MGPKRVIVEHGITEYSTLSPSSEMGPNHEIQFSPVSSLQFFREDSDPSARKTERIFKSLRQVYK